MDPTGGTDPGFDGGADERTDLRVSDEGGGRRGSLRLLAAVRQFDRVDLAVLGSVALVYLVTLQRGPGLADSGKFAFQPHLFGVPHATGYPLYTVIAGAWSHLVAVGGLGTRANLFSAASGVAVCAVLVAVLRHLRVGSPGRVVGVAVFALAGVVWVQSTVAEVYTFSLFAVALVVLFGVRVLETERTGDLAVMLFLWALCFTTHLTAVTMAPAIAYVVVRTLRRRPPTRHQMVVLGASCLAGAVAVAVAYSFLPFATALEVRYLESPVHSFDDLVAVVTGRDFRGQMFAFGPGALVTDRVPLLARLLWTNLWVTIVLVPFGVWRCWDRFGVFFGLLLGGSLGWMLNYDIADIEVYLLPSVFLLAVLAGCGLDRLARLGPELRWWAPAVAAAGMLLLLPTVVRGANEVTDEREATRQAVARMGVDAAAGPAVIVTNSSTGAGYAAFEYAAYRLLGEDRGRVEDLWLVDKPTAAEVRDHVEGTRPLDGSRTHYGTEPGPGEGPPAGLEVYVVDQPMATQLEQAGLTVTPDPSGRDLWRVTP